MTQTQTSSMGGMKGSERWQQWIDKGERHDARRRERFRLVAWTLGSLLALASAMALTLA